MPEYHRAFIPGGTYFFTLVTFDRAPILVSEQARSLLHWVWMDVNHRFPFTTEAICLLPDHLHCIWSLPEGDSNYPIRWKEIKRLFSKHYRDLHYPSAAKTESRIKREEATIWQRRFWEHVIRDVQDLHAHLDYIHYNPVRHGLVNQPADWQWSSFHRYLRKGYYDPNWGGGDQNGLPATFGE
jgi:putative transposase